jgi:NAD(P)-dependent dehydrogenase (short-subunit alcohol dehydrogenase family)
MDLNNRVAVVTGGASGLGRATAIDFAKSGALVAVLDRDGAGAQAVAKELGGGAAGLEVDIADEQSVSAAMSYIDDNYAGVHICVNAAGISIAGKIVSRSAPLPLPEFRRVIDVNLIGTFDVMRHCAMRMIGNDPDETGERGVIVNVSSGAAWQGQTGQAAYAASKAALIGLGLPVARDLASRGVRVVTIAPGLFDTPLAAGLPDAVKGVVLGMILNPKRLGDPREFAALAHHIVENPYLNATTIALDAGTRVV